MFHLAAFSSSIAASTEADVSALSDDILTISSNRFQLQRDWMLNFAVGVGTDLQRMQLNQPSMRSIALPYVRPFNDGANLPTKPAIADYRRSPFKLRANEQFGLKAYQDNAGAQQATCLVGLFDMVTPIPVGDIVTIRGTHSTTVTAHAWTSTPITWDDNLEGGYYAVVGGVGISSTGIAFRLIGQNNVWRPGGLCVGDVNEEENMAFRNGGMGKWLEFESDANPNIQFLCSGADTSGEVYLDLVKVGG